MKSNMVRFLVVIFLGLVFLAFDFLLYPLLLPSTISQDKLRQIEAAAYAFYALFVIGLLTVAYGVHSLIFRIRDKTQPLASPPGELKREIRSPLILTLDSMFETAITIMAERRNYKYFWAIGSGYGIVYGVVSGLLIFHQGGFNVEYGVDVPSTIIMSYGPVGYVPTLAIYVTNNVGLFVIPINLLVILIISALVGFNGALTVYAIKKRRERSLVTKSGRYSLVNLAGSTLALFAVCPTCASFYIFAVLAGSLAPSIAAFTVAFYTMFLGISIPLLVGSSLVTLYGICKVENTKTCDFR
ncbi:MAG: hypothetical protein ACJ71D_09125 [Nitrososphaera sp.]